MRFAKLFNIKEDQILVIKVLPVPDTSQTEFEMSIQTMIDKIACDLAVTFKSEDDLTKGFDEFTLENAQKVHKAFYDRIHPPNEPKVFPSDPQLN